MGQLKMEKVQNKEILAFMPFLLKTISISINGPIVSHSWQRGDDDLGRKWHFVKIFGRKWHFLKIFGPIVSHSWQRDDDDLGRVGKRNSSLVEIQPNNV